MHDQLSRVEKGRDGRRAGLRIRQGHVARRSHEIDRIALKPRTIDALAPAKDVKRQCPLSTQRMNLGCGAAVHVELPVERRQWREVVATGTIPRPPRQTAPPVTAPGPALAHAAATIVPRGLRHRAKRKTPPAG